MKHSSSYEPVEEAYIQRFRAKQRKYDFYKRLHRFLDTALRTIILAGAASLPVLLNFKAPPLITTIVSIMVFGASALESFYKFSDRSHTFLLMSEGFRKELDLFDLRRGSYKGLDSEQALDHFVKQAQELDERLDKLYFSLEEPKQKQEQEQKEK